MTSSCFDKLHVGCGVRAPVGDGHVDPALGQPGHELRHGALHWARVVRSVAAPVHAMQRPVFHQGEVGGHLQGEIRV